MQINVTNNRSAQQFEAQVDGYQALIRYTLAGRTMTMTHTEVPDELGGRGVGSQLVRGALEQARVEGLQVVPVCPFIASYIARHEEYQSLVVKS